MKFKFTILIIIIFSIKLVAQAPDKTKALATQYYQNGNYEKSAILFEELHNKEPKNTYYYPMLFNALLRLNEYSKLEKIIKKQLKRNKGNNSFTIDLAFIYLKNNQIEKSKSLNNKVISNLKDDLQIRTVANKYISFNQIDYLLQTYEKGNNIFDDLNKYTYQIGDAYNRLNKIEKAIDYWILYVENNNNFLPNIKSTFSRNLKKDGFQESLESQLYARIQDKPNEVIYFELLIWLFINQKDYESAMVQAKALDKKNKEDGFRIIELAQSALNEEEYDAAIVGYNYILEKGEERYNFRRAKSGILEARKQKILKQNDYTQEDLIALKTDYTNYLETYGKSIANAKTIRELANLEAKYLDNVSEGILLLENLLKEVAIKKKLKNKIKLDLGDLYILSEDVWEAVLTYAQVDKDEKDSPLGEEARFRNAKLSYYLGDFEWAQAQLTVLKGSTTELIANDALKLSVFIIDNLGLDTSKTAMQMYSEAELLLIQNKKNQAINILDSIMTLFPQHVLEDDILFKKSVIYSKYKDFKNVEINLLKLLESYSFDILADNATFMLAELYDYRLKNKEKATEYYEKMILDFSDSIFMIKSRKRYRELR